MLQMMRYKKYSETLTERPKSYLDTKYANQSITSEQKNKRQNNS